MVFQDDRFLPLSSSSLCWVPACLARGGQDHWILYQRTHDTKCFSNLGDCRGLSKEARRWNSRNQGSSQVTVWQWLTRAHRGKLTSRPRIQKQTKQEDTKILATIQNFRRRQERYRPKQTQPTLQGPSSTTMWVWLSL